MTEAPLSTPSQEKIESLKIEQNDKKYLLLIKILGESISFILSQPEEVGSLTYSRKMTLKEIKEKETHNLFTGLNSCQEFLDYLKALSEMKKLSIIEKEDKLTLNFIVEYLLKKHSVEFELNPDKINLDSVVQNLCKEFNIFKSKNENLENENKELKKSIERLNKENLGLKEEIKYLKEEIKEIKKIIEPINKKFKESININKYTFDNKSVIMKENEFNLIHLAIKSRMNKEVKELKKLYQATIDGDGAINFHSKCDNIPNTLVLIKSAGNRRFGGFISQTWESHSSGAYKDDKNAFLFSLDKQKIYSYKNNGNAIYNRKDYGPTFGTTHDIYIGNNAIQEKKSYTYESSSSCSFNYNGDNNALSEDGRASHIFIAEYEVFQVIFS